MKKAFKITAKISGKSWESRATVLTAPNELEAIEKAKSVMMLTPEHDLEVQAVDVYSTGDKISTDNYPYGRLRCTAYFSVEYNKKGMRSVFQTIDPKTGRLNKPKNSTYCPVILPMRNPDNGHIDFCGYLSFNGTAEINKGLYFMSDFCDLFTPEQIKDIALTIIAMTKVNAKAQVIYCGTEWELLKPHYDLPISNLCKIAKGENTDFLSCLLNFDAIEALKKPDFNPFKVVSYTIGE